MSTAHSRVIAALILACAAFSSCAPLARTPIVSPSPLPTSTPTPTPSPTPKRQAFEATAYSIKGRTASGKRARSGMVAADPRVLPLGTRIRVHGAGRYTGVYTVSDTGRTIKGREIDIFVPNARAARRFGRRQVQVEVLD